MKSKTIKSLAVSVAFLSGLGAGHSASAQSLNAQYGQTCSAEVVSIDDFDCGSGVIVPITVNGQVPQTYTANMTCDRPSMLDNGVDSDGQCVPNSRILNLSKDGAQVAVMCRQKKIRPANSLNFDEIDVIAHNPSTGATCWFQAKADPGKTLDGNNVPSPTAATDDSYWKEPSAVVKDDCGGCHDNDPFMYSPFVGQVWPIMPTDPFGPYYHIEPAMGFDAWPTEHITPRDSTCVGCHRMGIQETCGELTAWMTGLTPTPGGDQWALSYPGSHSMPIGQTLTELEWNTIHAGSVAMIHGDSSAQPPITGCCGSGSNQAKCNKTPLPTYQK